MPTFRHGQGVNADWRRATRECLEQLGSGGGTLGFLYATDYFAADLGLVLEEMKEATGVPHWVGTVGSGGARHRA